MGKFGFGKLHQMTVKTGLCTGCGTCVGVCPVSAIDYDMKSESVRLTGKCINCGLCLTVCPGKDIPLPELERAFLGRTRTPSEEFLGVSRSFLMGNSEDSDIRQVAASGGLVTSVLCFALDSSIIDGAIVVGMDTQQPWRVMPFLARTASEILQAAKSKYSISPSNVLLRELKPADRIAAVGLPCHIHGIRKVQQHPDLTALSKKIVLTIGLFCGTNWSSKATARLIRKYTDFKLDQIERFDYRGGPEGQDIVIRTQDKRECRLNAGQMRSVFYPMMKDRCRLCCDWSAEVADISIGDIFDPREQGLVRKIPNWNSIIVRSLCGQHIIDEACNESVIRVLPLGKESFYGNIGFELKKGGAVYNFLERKRHRLPVPDYHMNFNWQPKRHKHYPVPEG